MRHSLSVIPPNIISRDNCWLVIALLFGCVFSLQAASSCNYVPQSPRPDWVLSQAGADSRRYYGVSVVELNKLAYEEGLALAKQNALAQLSESIQVTVSTSIRIQQMQNQETLNTRDIKALIETTTEQTLNGVTQDGIWLDQKPCVLWLMLSIHEDDVSVQQAKQLNVVRYQNLKAATAIIEAKDSLPAEKNRNIAIAKNILSKLDFSSIESTEPKAYFVNIVNRAENFSLAGKTISLGCFFKTPEKINAWNKACSEFQQVLQSYGASVTILTTQQALTFSEQKPTNNVLLVLAEGKIEGRTKPNEAEDSSYRFQGEIQATLTLESSGIDDSFQGVTGWNPISAEMAMDILAINVAKRFRKRIDQHQ